MEKRPFVTNVFNVTMAGEEASGDKPATPDVRVVLPATIVGEKAEKRKVSVLSLEGNYDYSTDLAELDAAYEPDFSANLLDGALKLAHQRDANTWMSNRFKALLAESPREKWNDEDEKTLIAQQVVEEAKEQLALGNLKPSYEGSSNAGNKGQFKAMVSFIQDLIKQTGLSVEQIRPSIKSQLEAQKTPPANIDAAVDRVVALVNAAPTA